jgi:hypothetical protein
MFQGLTRQGLSLHQRWFVFLNEALNVTGLVRCKA